MTAFPASIIPALEAHLKRVKLQHEKDLADGYGGVYLPHALDRKYGGAAKSWGWQDVFPAREMSRDPRSGSIRRHHIDPSAFPGGFLLFTRPTHGCHLELLAWRCQQGTRPAGKGVV